MSFSSADGSGEFLMRKGDESLIEHEEKLWAGQLSQRWEGEYEPEVFLNFAAYLIGRALPEKIGREWKQFEPEFAHDILSRAESEPKYTDEEQAGLRELSRQFLKWHADGGEKISSPIAVEAARVIGEFAIDDASWEKLLRKILAELPPPGPPLRDFDEVRAEMAPLEKIAQLVHRSGDF